MPKAVCRIFETQAIDLFTFASAASAEFPAEHSSVCASAKMTRQGQASRQAAAPGCESHTDSQLSLRY